MPVATEVKKGPILRKWWSWWLLAMGLERWRKSCATSRGHFQYFSLNRKNRNEPLNSFSRWRDGWPRATRKTHREFPRCLVIQPCFPAASVASWPSPPSPCSSACAEPSSWWRRRRRQSCVAAPKRRLGRVMASPRCFLKFTIWLCQNSYWKWPFIVDFPINNGDFP